MLNKANVSVEEINKIENEVFNTLKKKNISLIKNIMKNYLNLIIYFCFCTNFIK